MSSTSFTRNRVTRSQTASKQGQVTDENAIRGKPAAVPAARTRSAFSSIPSARQPAAPTQSTSTAQKRVATTAAAPLHAARRDTSTVAPKETKPKLVVKPAPPVVEVYEDVIEDMIQSDDEENESMEIDAMEEDDMADYVEKPSKIARTLQNVQDIDQYDIEDVQFCTEYVNQIFAHLREKEAENRIDPEYMEKQVDLNAKYRTIMVDWMAEVVVKFGLLTETFFLSVNIIDRFLQHKAVARTRFQLVGIAAMLIASKFEEIYTPKVDDFIYITANAYTREDLLKMEKMILMTLDFNLNIPSPLHFLRRFSKAANSNVKIHTLSKYIIELSLLDYDFLDHSSSVIAASATYLARAMTRSSRPTVETIWNDTLEHYTGYSVEDIMPCVESLNQLISIQNSNYAYKAIFRKYSSSKLESVAAIPATKL